ncbi:MULTISPECIES: hypothetical protein [Brevibacterium]|uniref:hypothetical protein n=1 Tax=Brevibacterium TaxID=1696 RepID=UPI000BF52A75|nr:MULTISPECIES: hypothetical protein [Brevibacterium]MCI4013113.1 hypothetical protein [Brevibacterium sp. ZH18]
MKRRDVLIAFAPLAIAGLAAAVFLAVYAYLYVFGTIFGFNVSTLDGSGPRWPFPTMYLSGLTFAIAAPAGIAWALIYTLGIKKIGKSRKSASPSALHTA